MAAQQQISFFFGEQSPLPFSPSLAGFPGTETLESEVKEVTEESGKSAAAMAAPRTGSGSKRSRAAEVHNLSEKRRRSRINEKMRALQNLIPNSNKTDKASMLDEAIEYLKQLQLQVQMLSMRNGLSLHDMYLSGMVQPQPPLKAPEICMGFSGDNRIALNMGSGMLPLNHDSLAQNQQVSSSHHSIILPIVTRLTVPQTSYGVESSQLPLTAEMLAEDMVLQQQLDAGPGERDPTHVVKAMALHFRGECSLLEDHGELQIGILGREGTQNMLDKDSNHQFNIHHLDGGHRKVTRPCTGADVCPVGMSRK